MRSIDALRTGVTTAGGTPTQFTHVGLLRELLSAMGGSPTKFTVRELLQQIILFKNAGATLQQGLRELLVQAITTLGGTVTDYGYEAMWVQLAGLATVAVSPPVFSYGATLPTRTEPDASHYSFSTVALPVGYLLVVDPFITVAETAISCVPSAGGTTINLTQRSSAAHNNVSASATYWSAQIAQATNYNIAGTAGGTSVMRPVVLAMTSGNPVPVSVTRFSDSTDTTGKITLPALTIGQNQRGLWFFHMPDLNSAPVFSGGTLLVKDSTSPGTGNGSPAVAEVTNGQQLVISHFGTSQALGAIGIVFDHA